MKTLFKLGILTVLVLLIIGMVFNFGLKWLVTSPLSPYYIDWEDPDPIYFEHKQLVMTPKGRLVLEPASRDIVYLSLEEFPQELIEAFVAIEDTRFYRHSGYDLVGILRAAWTNMAHGEIRQGGSTITQQLARNLFLGHARTMNRKILEVAIARELENRYSKDEIMEMYLNQVYFGNGNWGVQQAATDYFNKSAQDLTLREASLLAGLVQAPSRYAPVSTWSLAVSRQRLVLQRMLELDMISEEDAREALFEEKITKGTGLRPVPGLIGTYS